MQEATNAWSFALFQRIYATVLLTQMRMQTPINHKCERVMQGACWEKRRLFHRGPLNDNWVPMSCALGLQVLRHSNGHVHFPTQLSEA